MSEPVRIGFYVCHCGTNIAGMVDVEAVAKYAAKLPGVAVSRDYKYMCSDPGQELIQQDIKEHKLNRVVVAACSPLLHERTFRNATMKGGLSPFFFQMVNIREHDAWVHTDGAEATRKALALVRAAIRRVPFHKPLEIKKVPINPDVLVVGGGIAGIHAALTLANGGQKVYLVEREATIGGHMAKFDKTFPTLDCAACILTPKMSAGGRAPEHHPVDLFRGRQGGAATSGTTRSRSSASPATSSRTCARLRRVHRGLRLQGAAVRGRVQRGSRQAQARLHAVPAGGAAHRHDRSGHLPRLDPRASARRPASRPAATARPSTSARRRSSRRSRSARSSWPPVSRSSTRSACPTTATASTRTSTTRSRSSAWSTPRGPTGGEIVMRNGKKPKSVGIIHCVGSRDENTNRWCSRVCCMYSLKLAHLIKEHTHAEVYNFYIDMRTPGQEHGGVLQPHRRGGRALHPRQGGRRLPGPERPRGRAG